MLPPLKWLKSAAHSYIVAAIGVLLVANTLVIDQLHDHAPWPVFAFELSCLALAFTGALLSRLQLKYSRPQLGVIIPLLGLLKRDGLLADWLATWSLKQPTPRFRTRQWSAFAGSLFCMFFLGAACFVEMALSNIDAGNSMIPYGTQANFVLWDSRSLDAFWVGAALFVAVVLFGLTAVLVVVGHFAYAPDVAGNRARRGSQPIAPAALSPRQPAPAFANVAP